jgi:hypothetical protein
MPNMTIGMELVTAGAMPPRSRSRWSLRFVPGSAGYFNPVTGAGEAPYGPEVEIMKVWWPYKRISATGRLVDARHDLPVILLPDATIEDIVNTIIEDYNPADDAPERE